MNKIIQSEQQKKKGNTIPFRCLGIGTRISDASKEVGGKKRLAELAGISESQLHRIISGESQAKIEQVAAIASVTGKTIAWISIGLEEQRSTGTNESKGVYASIPRHTRLEDDNEVDVDSEIASLSLNSKWLEQKGLAPKDIVYTRMPDDSMKPTVQEGGLVVIDASTDKLRGDGLYALLYRDVPTVKRLHMEHAGDLLIFNDNDIYSPERIDAEKTNTLLIIGKVIWVGGEV